MPDLIEVVTERMWRARCHAQGLTDESEVLAQWRMRTGEQAAFRSMASVAVDLMAHGVVTEGGVRNALVAVQEGFVTHACLEGGRVKTWMETTTDGPGEAAGALAGGVPLGGVVPAPTNAALAPGYDDPLPAHAEHG